MCEAEEGWAVNTDGAVCAGAEGGRGCANLPWQLEPAGEENPAWRVLLSGQLGFGIVKVGGWLYSVPGHLCSPSHSTSWKVAEM